MKRIRIVLLIAFAGIMLSSCSLQSHKPVLSEETAATEETEAAEIPSREAVFVYGNQKNSPSKLVLTFSSEPVLLPSGYVRLVGVVSGGRPIACLEIGGRGLALGEGELVDAYRVVGIGSNNVVLERR